MERHGIDYNKTPFEEPLELFQEGLFVISEDGVKIKGVHYDLGSYNSPNYSAKQISPTQLGIFDQQKTLIGIADFTATKEDADKYVLTVEPPNLNNFLGLSGSPNSPFSKNLTQTEAVCYYRQLENVYNIYRELGLSISITDLTLKQQQVVMDYFLQKSTDEKILFLYGMIMEGGQENIKEDLPYFGGLALDFIQVVDRYSDLSRQKLILGAHQVICSVDPVRDMFKEGASPTEKFIKSTQEHHPLAQIYASQKIDPGYEPLIREVVENHARNFLTTVSSQEYTEEEIRDIADTYMDNQEILLATFKSLVKNRHMKDPSVDLGDLKRFSFETKTPNEIPKETKLEMIKLSKANYLNRNGPTKQLYDALFSTDKTNTRFHILTDEQEKLVAFLRSDQLSKDHIYVGSFNVKPSTKGYAVGSTILVETIRSLTEQYTVEAIATPELKAMTHYIEQVGFSATEFVKPKDADDSPTGWFKIEIPIEPVPSILRNRDLGDLTRELKKERNYDPLSRVGEPYVLAQFNTQIEIDNLMRVSQVLMNENGYRLTRYVCLDKDCNERLLGFEKQEK